MAHHNLAREALRLHKRELAVAIRLLLREHKLSIEEASMDLNISSSSMQKASNQNSAENVSLDMLFYIHYSLDRRKLA